MSATKQLILANGFIAICMDSLWLRFKLSVLLTFKYGFYREGQWSSTETDEEIYAHFVRENLRILAGWDQRLGHYLLADNQQSNVFLRSFYQEHVMWPSH